MEVILSVMGHVRIQERALLVADTGVWLVYSRQRTTMLINNLQLLVWHPSAENHPPPNTRCSQVENDAPNFGLLVLGTIQYRMRSLLPLM